MEFRARLLAFRLGMEYPRAEWRSLGLEPFLQEGVEGFSNVRGKGESTVWEVKLGRFWKPLPVYKRSQQLPGEGNPGEGSLWGRGPWGRRLTRRGGAACKQCTELKAVVFGLSPTPWWLFDGFQSS